MAEGLAELHRAAELARETQSWTDLARAAVNESAILQATGRLDQAAELALRAAADAAQHGLERSNGNFLRLNAVECLFELGRFDEAEAELERIDRTRPVGLDLLRRLDAGIELDAVRGEIERATESLARMRRAAAAKIDPGSSRFGAAKLSWRSRPATTISWRCSSPTVRAVGATTTTSSWSSTRRREPPIAPTKPAVAPMRWARAMRCTTRWICVERIRRRRDSKNAGEDESVTAGYLEVAEGELARAEGRNDPEPWSAAARVWRREGREYRLAYARLREADAWLRSGAGAAAAQEPLTEARSVAASIGARQLLEQIEALAGAVASMSASKVSRATGRSTGSGSPIANAKCWRWLRRAARTVRSRRRCSSAPRPRACTSPTS